MRLTRFTDNALRCLVYLGIADTDPTPAGVVAARMGMSEDHLMKVVQRLAQLGVVATVRGRGGGMRLARPAAEISIGTVVRATEGNMCLVPCFDGGDEAACPITAACAIVPALEAAREAFLARLDEVTLASLLAPRRQLRALTGVELVSPPRREMPILPMVAGVH